MGVDTKQYPQYDYGVNSTHYYVTKFYQAHKFLNDLLSGTITSYSTTSLFQNDSDYITSVRMFPFDLSKIWEMGNTLGYVYLGKKTLSYSDYAFDIPYASGNYAPVKKWFSFTLTRTHNNFLDYPPYTKAKLNIPMFTSVDLPLELCYGYEIETYLSVDVRTGSATVSLFRKTDGLQIYTETRNISIELPFGKSNEEEQQRNRILQGISIGGSAIGLLVGAYTGNPLISSASIGMLTKNVTQAINNEVDRFNSSSGLNGSTSTYMNSKDITLVVETPKDVTVPDVALKGGVCKQNLSLSTVTGYTEIGEIHFNPMGNDIYDDEISELNDLLRDGIIL